ncbi:MAG: hypothetical protein ACI9WM_001509, partial [Arenicella sp.]
SMFCDFSIVWALAIMLISRMRGKVNLYLRKRI